MNTTKLALEGYCKPTSNRDITRKSDKIKLTATEVLRRYKCGERDFRNFDLREEDFSNCELQESDFSDCLLCGAKFKNCDLRHVDFIKTKLYKAEFSGSDARWTDFRWSNARLAVFSGCDLSVSDFRWTDLRWTNFLGVGIPFAKFLGADLLEAKIEINGFWLEQLQNKTPSVPGLKNFGAKDGQKAYDYYKEENLQRGKSMNTMNTNETERPIVINVHTVVLLAIDDPERIAYFRRINCKADDETTLAYMNTLFPCHKCGDKRDPAFGVKEHLCNKCSYEEAINDPVKPRDSKYRCY